MKSLLQPCGLIKLVEVSPRDGLQSLPGVYPTDVKVQLIDALSAAGLPKIEVSSFVRPDVVPQLADAEDVFSRIKRRPGTVYRGVCANRRGAERAVSAGVDELLAFITASPTYNLKNAGMSIEENVREIERIVRVVEMAGIPLVVGIGVCTFCPYEGEIPVNRLLEILGSIWSLGVLEFYVGTSVGVDGPRRIFELTSTILDRWPSMTLGLHMHNTNGMALANAVAGLQAGVTVYEGAVCGIGGGIRMPQHMAPYGNDATE
jgi:hydroxymethylglutaryl-CoA lyase